MAIEFYSSIDLNKNELQNAALQVLSAKPGSPATGQIFFDSDVAQVQVYNGSAWEGLQTETADGALQFNTALKIGRDADNLLDFTTDNQITFRVSAANNVIFKASGEIEASSLDISGNADIAGDLTGLDNVTSTNFIIGGHTIDDVDIAGEFVDSANHLLTSAAALDKFHVLNADTTGTATNALHVLVTDNESTDEENQITFIEGAAGGTAQRGLEADGNLTYNPSSGTLSSTVFRGNYNIGGHAINDIDITSEFVDDNAHVMSSKAIGTRFSLKAGSTSIVTTGVLNAGSINTSFGNINNGASTITTTGLISGGSLDIDNVLINGSNIGHTDDTDLIALANGAVTVNGSLTVTGTTTTNNVETVSTSSGIVFEGAAADGHDATLTSTVASSDKTYTLPNLAGHIPLLAVAATATITSTPAELNKLDGATVVVGEINALDLGSTAVGNAIASKAVVLDSSKDFTGINSLGSDNYVVGGHTIDDIDITAEFVDADAHIMSSKAIGARFAQKNADTTGTATNSVHVLVTDNENTDEENQITFIEGAGGGGAQRGLEADGHLTYNPSSGTVSATIFKGNIDAVNGDFDGTLETDALTIAGTAIVAQATASAVGGVELATAAEVLTGTDAARVVTADTLSAKSVVAVIDVSSLTDANIVTIPHNLGTADVMVQVYDITTEANIMCDIARTTDDFSTASTSSISIDFGTAPPNDCRCLITSLKGASASGTVAYT